MPFGVIANEFKDLFNKIFGRFPRSSLKFLKSKGDLTIDHMKIRRTPIMGAINKALNIISLGKWEDAKDKYNYDKFFHLSLVVTLSDGKSFVIEKNATPNIGGSVPRPTDETEVKEVPLNGEHLNCNMLVERTIKAIGSDRFLTYDAFDTNCQRFVLDILQSNDLSNSDVESFVLQPVSDLVEELPGYIQKVAKESTDTASMLDRAVQALGFRRGGLIKRKHRRFGIL